MMSISPLPEGVRSSVRSGIILFDLTRVVEELVFNSLDAGATKVSVHVGVGAGVVKVVDDGSGITRDGLVLLGERYATSKFHRLADVDSDGGSFGFRGEALASISDVSLLEIVTKAYGRPNGYRKVIKGCKCLYLGIDDDRKDVGTTVNVRDLFYNQPVRRKYMQSSPKKVLHSVKKCILRIALVHSQISFKIVDVESGDELLWTQPSSPLFILKSGFGLEVPHSLHELNISDGVLKLSGYISDPVVSFITKAFQYVYINSRFVCKGPIHKLLNQLASTFECLDLWKVSDGSQNRKRSRSKACPSYVLNLSCHRTLYDLAFEPSKTYVEFKDWDTVLAFTKKAIQQLWKENPTFDDVIRKDQIWKEAEDVLTADEDFADADFSETSAISKKKHKTENHKAWLEIFSSPLSSENNLLSVEDPFLDNRSNDNFDNCLSSAWGVKSLEEDPGASNELAEIALSCDLVSGCIGKPLLQGCSSKSNLPLERALLVNDEEFEFQIDSFRTNQKQAGPDDRVDIFEVDGTNQSFDILSRTYGSDKASTSQAFTREITHCSVFTDSDFPSRAFAKSIPSYADHFIGEDFIESNTKTGIGNFCSGHQTSNSDWCFLSSAPLLQETPWDVKHSKSENACWWSSHSAESTSWQFMECGERGHKSRYGIMSKGSSQENCSSSGRYNMLHVNDCFGSGGDTCKFLQGYNGQYEFSPEYADLLPDETGNLHLESCFKNYTGIDQYKRQRDLVRHQRYEPGHVSKERSRRSHSAPPFYKGKRRFFSLNHPSIVNAENPEVNAIHNALTYSEVNGLKNARQLSDNCHLYHKPSTVEHLSSDSRLDMDKITGVSANSKEIGKGEKFEQSPNFDFQDTAPDRVFISGESQDSLDSWSKWQNCSSHITDRNKSSDVYDKSNILNISSGFLHLAGDLLVPESINKSCLVDAKVLQQVDKKFIPVVGGGILAIIDQHAADERIRLEELRKKVLSGEAKTVHYLDGEQELMLPEIAYQLLQNYTEEIKVWGWICNIDHQDSRLFKRNLNLLHKRQAVIKLVAVPNILGVNLSDVDLLEFLHQLADTDGSSTMPPSVLRVLNMKACRGAIMFGDSLLPSECSLLVEELKQTSLCFQCAHGRPTTIPLVNLDALHKQIANLGLSDGESNKSWHGLRQHEVNIERAAQRLNSARG